jgi:hypothetical protein
VLEQLLAVVRNARLPRADSWLLSIARFLLLHACFKDVPQLEHVRCGSEIYKALWAAIDGMDSVFRVFSRNFPKRGKVDLRHNLWVTMCVSSCV